MQAYASGNFDCVEDITSITAPTQDVLHLIDDRLATTMYSIQSTILASPLMLSCDKLLNIPLIAERQTINCNRETLVNEALLINNQPCINYGDFVAQQVLKYDQKIKGKLAIKTSGPFKIVHIHMISTFTIQLQVSLMEQIHICHTIPYKISLV